MKILVVDDEKLLVKGIKFNLENEGYQVETAFDGAAAVELARSESFDLIILDLMMPEVDGLTACMRIREFSAVPIIMLTAKDETFDKVLGLELGADDYISKPFGVLELTARVNVALRKQAVSDVLVCGNISLDEKSMSVSIDGRPVELNNKEFHLLRFLMRNEGRALSRDAILDAVWGYDEGETRTVDNHIARLRKLGVHNIETVFGVGYKLGKSEVLK